MLYILHGKDKESLKKKSKSLVSGLQKKRPDAEVFTLTSETFGEGKFNELLSSQGLFSTRYIVVLSNVFENSEAREIILKEAKKLKESENIVILIEQSFKKADEKKLFKYAEDVQEFVSKVEKKKEEYKPFGLTDALGKRDKKALWTQFHEALMNNQPAEQVFSVLFWQIKSMIVASKTKSAKEADMKPFVYNKSKSFAKNYSEDELLKLSSSFLLISLLLLR